MAKLSYSYYTEQDAAQVAALMRRNVFWMGKYNRGLDQESFSLYQKEKGFVFGIVGRVGDAAVSYVGCYQFGSNRVATRKQLIVSGLIIDSRYRTAIFSISEMFKLLLLRAYDLGYNELISEVGVRNSASLFMMKKTGFLMLDRTPTIYNEVVLRNYMPSILQCIQTPDRPIDEDFINNGMRPLCKGKQFEEPQFIKKDIVTSTWLSDDDVFEFYVDVRNGEVVGVQKQGQYKIAKAGRGRFSFECFCENLGPVNYTIQMQNGTEETKTLENPGAKTNIKIPSKAKSLDFYVVQTRTNYHFSADEEPRGAGKEIPLGKTRRLSQSGYLYLGKDEEALCEIWPCMHYPYLESFMTPNEEKNISIQSGGAQLTVTNQTSYGTLQRKYYVNKNTTEIASVFEGEHSGDFAPLFHFAAPVSGTVIRRIFADGTESAGNSDDMADVFPELLFENFKKERAGSGLVHAVEVETGQASYRICAAEDFRCFINRNYIVIQFPACEAEGMKVSFPKLVIEEISNSK